MQIGRVVILLCLLLLTKNAFGWQFGDPLPFALPECGSLDPRNEVDNGGQTIDPMEWVDAPGGSHNFCLKEEAQDIMGQERIRHAYPYAQETNGCSNVPDNVGRVSFKDVCDAHDKCYYTYVGTDDTETQQNQAFACNQEFAEGLFQACINQTKVRTPVCTEYKPKWQGLKTYFECINTEYVTIVDEPTRAVCITVAGLYTVGVTAAQMSTFRSAQNKQKHYIAWVEKLVREFQIIGDELKAATTRKQVHVLYQTYYSRMANDIEMQESLDLLIQGYSLEWLESTIVANIKTTIREMYYRIWAYPNDYIPQFTLVGPRTPAIEEYDHANNLLRSGLSIVKIENVLRATELSVYRPFLTQLYGDDRVTDSTLYEVSTENIRLYLAPEDVQLHIMDDEVKHLYNTTFNAIPEEAQRRDGVDYLNSGHSVSDLQKRYLNHIAAVETLLSDMLGHPPTTASEQALLNDLRRATDCNLACIRVRIAQSDDFLQILNALLWGILDRGYIPEIDNQTYTGFWGRTATGLIENHDGLRAEIAASSEAKTRLEALYQNVWRHPIDQETLEYFTFVLSTGGTLTDVRAEMEDNYFQMVMVPVLIVTSIL